MITRTRRRALRVGWRRENPSGGARTLVRVEAERPQRRFAELRPPGPPAVRVRFRAEWVETLPADWQPPGPGDTVILDPEVELTVWSVERIAIGLEVGCPT